MTSDLLQSVYDELAANHIVNATKIWRRLLQQKGLLGKYHYDLEKLLQDFAVKDYVGARNHFTEVLTRCRGELDEEKGSWT